jgi:thiol-disulfide isomerase/thioredoxin
MTSKYQLAKPLITSEWLNTDKPLTFEDFRGRVTLVTIFQFLCPSCMSHAVPQAKRVRELFAEEDVVVIGLHTVFKQHDKQTPDAVARMVRENDIRFPVAIDKQDAGAHLGETFQTYELRGTPTQLLLDRDGNLRKNKFGFDSDLQLGAEIMALLRDRETGLQYTQQHREGAA